MRDGGVIEERATMVAVSYDVRYRLPAIADLPGLTGRVLERHVQCTFTDDRVIEIRQEGL